MTDNIRILARDVFGDDQWTEWTRAVDIIEAKCPDDVPDVLKRVEQANRDSFFALGFVSYEAGSVFDSRIQTGIPRATPPLAWFALFSECSVYNPVANRKTRKLNWRPTEEKDAYRKKIDRIKEHIGAGETYQVNYTFKLKASGQINASAWFHELYKRQPTRYAMLIETPEFDVISISPESFFRLDGSSITCEPMKGTCSRAPHPLLDESRGRELQTSGKNRAENVMIVDMVRNDLGRIAETDSIKVDELFKVSSWPTLWQMTSVVSATTNAGLLDVFNMLFPSASITGAPKRQTASIIAELEDEPRGLYTGAIGWSLPGRKAQFAVAIRTAVHDKRTGITEYGIGSGIVWDSEAEGEYEECILKSKLLAGCDAHFSILETLRWDRESGYRFLDGHLKRLAATANFFGFSTDPKAVVDALESKARTFTADHMRIRLLSDDNGNITLEGQELDRAANFDDPDAAMMYSARIDEHRNSTDSPFLYHKTTNRRFYDEARERNRDVDEVLLINTRDEAMEFSTGNLVIRKGDEWLTPAISSGLLSGVLRNHLIDKGRIREAVITVEEVKTADEIFFINSVRGWFRVLLID